MKKFLRLRDRSYPVWKADMLGLVQLAAAISLVIWTTGNWPTLGYTWIGCGAVSFLFIPAARWRFRSNTRPDWLDYLSHVGFGVIGLVILVFFMIFVESNDQSA